MNQGPLAPSSLTQKLEFVEYAIFHFHLNTCYTWITANECHEAEFIIVFPLIICTPRS